MTAKKKPAPPVPPIGADEDQARRLKRLREAFDYDTVVGFAAFLGISANRWYNFENGKPLGREIAFLLVQRLPGLTLDWLYFGRPDGLPLELARRLGVFDLPGNRNTV